MTNIQLVERIEEMLKSTPMNNASLTETCEILGLSEADAAGLDVLMDFTPEYTGRLRFAHSRTHDGHDWVGFILA